MAITTKHKIEITIDDDIFNIVVNELSEDQQKKLEKKFGKHTEALQEIQKISSKLVRTQELYSMLKDAGRTDDAIEAFNKIEAIENELEAKTPIIKASAEELENILKDRLNMTVNGDDKESFLSCLIERNISFKTAFDDITNAVAESKAKK